MTVKTTIDVHEASIRIAGGPAVRMYFATPEEALDFQDRAAAITGVVAVETRHLGGRVLRTPDDALAIVRRLTGTG